MTTASTSRRSVRTAASRRFSALAAVGLAAGLLALGGCDRNRSTKDQTSLAQARMTQLKSGVQYQMAREQFLGGDLPKALRTIETGIAMQPGVAKSHVLRGRILLEQSKLESASEAFATAEQLDPKNVEAQYFMGIVNERFSRPDDALARYRKAMELDPANAQYPVAAAEMLVTNGRADEARALLEERRSVLPNNAAIRHSMGQIAMLERDFPAAVASFGEARLLAPDDNSVLESLARAQMAAGKFNDADVSLSQLLKTDGNKARRDLQLMRARCLVELDRAGDARSILINLTADETGQRDVQAWIALGEVAGGLNDDFRLRQAANRLTAMAPDRPEGFVLRALHLRRNNDGPGALSAVNRALSLSPAEGKSWLLKGLILADLGRYAEAREAVTQAAQKSPGDRAIQALAARLNGEDTLATVPTDSIR